MARTPRQQDTKTIPPAMDYAAHELQYNRFLNLVKWFCIHAALLLPALYFFIIAQAAAAGTLLLIAGIVVLAYGIYTTGGIRRDVEAAAETVGDPGRRRR